MGSNEECTQAVHVENIVKNFSEHIIGFLYIVEDLSLPYDMVNNFVDVVYKLINRLDKMPPGPV